MSRRVYIKNITKGSMGHDSHSGMKILGTGITGLVGSRVVELLKDKYTFENISSSTGIDITDKDAVTKAISASDAPFVLHLAAKSNVDLCEEEKSLGEKSNAWKTNVLGTQYIAEACKNTNKKLLYVSTDFVFDGENTPEGGYTEEDIPHPINWYAKTKYEGEKIVQKLATSWVILRLAYPYRASFVRNDFFRAIKSKLMNNHKTKVIADYIITPTFIDDFANAIDLIIQKNVHGIFHGVGSSSMHPYNAALSIANLFDLPKELIVPVRGEEYFAKMARRPFNLTVKNDKIIKLGTAMKTFEDGLQEVKKQLVI